MTDPAPEFDPTKFKETTREQWNAAAKGWNDWGPQLRAWVGPTTETMLDMAAVVAGSRVLDIAAGAGDQTLLAAERVGSEGYVLATDISPGILEFAAANARRAGFANVETKVIDGEELDVPGESFDAVICRLGLMFFPDLSKALKGVKRALKAGGRLAAIVFTTPEKNPTVAFPFAIGRRHANLPAPPPGRPGLFNLGGPGVIEDAFAAAGFGETETKIATPTFRFDSAEDYISFLRSSVGPLIHMLAALDPSARDAAWREIGEEARRFETDAGFESSTELLLAAAVK